MPIQDPHATTLKRQAGGPTYAARPFDEPQPTAPARKPPVLQQIKRTDYAEKSKGDKQYKDAIAAAQKQYEAENAAYATEKSQHDQDIRDWRSRKAAWDAGEGAKVGQSGAGQQRLQDYLKKPEAQEQQDFNAKMLAYPFLPAGLVATQFGKGMKSPFHKVGYGLAEIGAGEALRELEKQQQPDKYEDPAGYYKNQAYQNFLISTGMGAGTGSLRSAFMKPTPSGPSSLDKVLSAFGRQPSPTTPEPTPPQAPPVEPYEGKASDVVREIATDLGLKPGAKETKAELVDRALEAIKNTHEDRLANIATKTKGADPTAILKQLRNSTSPVKFGIGALGLGAAAAAMAPGEAEAATPTPRATPRKPSEETSSDLSDLEREYGTGLPKGAAREALKSAADTALTAAPVLGEARMALSAPSLYKPSAEDIAQDEYEQRGREEMAKPHEAKGGAVEHEFNSEHLRPHERSLIDNPEEAIHRASWQLPYLATGSGMVELTGDPDTFFGGKTPEHQQIYDNMLKAHKAFYDNAFKRLANKSPHSTPDQPVADEAPVAKEGFRHGGKVNGKSSPHLKQMNSIRDTFTLKLQDKEKVISSLEKAVARKPNAKLSKRLSKEKSEAQRIHEHLQKIMMHA